MKKLRISFEITIKNEDNQKSFDLIRKYGKCKGVTCSKCPFTNICDYTSDLPLLVPCCKIEEVTE